MTKKLNLNGLKVSSFVTKSPELGNVKGGATGSPLVCQSDACSHGLIVCPSNPCYITDEAACNSHTCRPVE